MHDEAMAQLIQVSSVKSVQEVLRWQDERYHFVEKVRRELWGNDLQALDAIICEQLSSVSAVVTS